MEIISQNKTSAAGMLFGAVALIITLFHFSFGPFTPPRPRLENVIAEQVSAVKKGIIAGLNGETLPAAANERAADMDKIMHGTEVALAIIALICAFIGGMRKESLWSVRGALIFGGGTLAFHALLFGLAIFCVIVLFLVVCSWLSGGSLF
ncbi:hypothetical protein [Citrobacter rodentium]|jgi:hypothetical protein|uniref:Membrane protein n=2 Tax=Citrobacter rodentium TaxID=67825 RepID=D2THY5_CITRI|nr:hypothetical protein [Citrobacter rodentium]KIQ48767.1 membrane protein [Citrobacter rodentium]QBY30374.1 hypothetical protein E2R62_17045 [Citrobacter rodentium]UHO32253.1 hypothetical protein K7R23_06090 [Citrobacter rodentium NBRC 105723 = DSM 16636]CBG90754.1 putative membrane protein [Citrobacter rodentium ICC168]HAT8014073.1 hypothetical protein [Citrobacter rodentium NBRC 105723 = DSM 16636]